jgi:precorrin-3B C17-methyltransferase
VIFARAVGRADQKVRISTVAEAQGAFADMATLVLIGASTTRLIPRDGADPWVYTPRSYGVRA